MDLKLAGTSVRAVSVGGMETCIELPSWKLCFDIGRCPPSAVRWPRVLFTHAHIDHMGGVPFHCATRDLLGQSAPEYVVPGENFAGFNALLDAWRSLDRSDMACSVVPVAPGDVVPLGHGREAHVFRAVHRVPAVGYALFAIRKRLKPELVGIPGPELGEMRRQGVAIDDEVRACEVVFCGDTTIDVVDRELDVRTAKLLILEVTFLDDRVPVEAARHKGHIHLDEVIARADKFENDAILMTHFSQRYGRDEIVRILDQRLPAHLRSRVTPLLPEPPWGPA